MTVALVEFNPFHDECLYSQVAFVKSEPANKVVLVYNRNLRARINYWEKIDASLPISSNQWGIGYFRILRFLKKHHVDKVVFNSVHYPQVSSLLRWALPRGRKYFGIVHDLQDLHSKPSREIDAKVSGYFVLNDYLLQRLQQLSSRADQFEAFYPMFFPEVKEISLNKPDNELWITIPGLLENSRRDYRKLLEAFRQGQLMQHIKLIFLGKSIFGKGEKTKIRKAFEDADQYGQCVFWDDFIDLPTFHAYLRNSDYLLPLLHAGSKAGDRYLDKITGLYNLGFAYGKRFLMESFLKQLEDFKQTAIFYDQETNLVEFLNNLEPPTPGSPYQAKKFSFDYQAKKYLDFLNA